MKSTCPICDSLESEDQPQAGTHGYTIVYECGTRIDKAIGYPEYSEFAQKCDEPLKSTNKEILEKILSSKKDKMNIIYTQEPAQIEGKSIFLAGPTPRSNIVKSWRPKAIELFSDLGFAGTIFIPELRSGPSSEFEYDKQIDWEHEALEKADVILFWIPRNLVNMPGFTTNIEFGYWLAKNPKKLIVGSPDGIS